MYRPAARGAGGIVASESPIASAIGRSVLDRGGNAIDAAASIVFGLNVARPQSCGIGGGGFMVIRTPAGQTTTIDTREIAPAAMQPDSFWENGAPLAFNEARWSGRSAGVPGTVAGWDRAIAAGPLANIGPGEIRIAELIELRRCCREDDN